jgi:cystathionine beta-lyase
MAPSKTFNVAGLSTSVIIASNPKILRQFNTQAQNAGLTEGNIFGIVALEAAYRDGAEWLDQLLAYLDGNMAFAQEFFRQRIPRIQFIRPEGTYLALLDCRELGMAQKELNEFFLKKAKVYFDDGSIFGDELIGFERANFGCPRGVLAQALENIERAVNAL